MFPQEQIIETLTRKIALLDQYSSTLERENIAKNNQTDTLYNQLHQIRGQNEILRSHLSKINQENINRNKSKHQLNLIQQQNQLLEIIVERDQSKSKQMELALQCGCQTQFQEIQQDSKIVNQTCTAQISNLLKTIEQKDQQIQRNAKQSEQMYEALMQLEEQNQSLRKGIIDAETKFNSQFKQLRSYQIQIQQYQCLLNQERSAFAQQKVSMQTKFNSNSAAVHQAEKLIIENNRLIQRIRMLEKQKNSLYSVLRGKNLSPLKASRSILKQNAQNSHKPSFAGTPFVNSDHKPTLNKISSHFGIGKQKQKLKDERWRKIQEKINEVKRENNQLRANLLIA